MPTGGLDVVAGSVLGDLAVGAEVGAGLGGLESAVSGQNILKGAAEGGIGGAFTGGGIGLGGEFLGSTLGATAAGALGGAAGGGLGGLVTGQNPLVSAAEGGIAGGISGSGLLSGSGSGDPTAAPSGAPANTPSAGASGGGASGGASAPAGITAEGFGPDATTLSQGFGANAAPSDPTSINTGTSIGSVGSQLTASSNPSASSPSTSTTNVGTGTTGTQGLSLGQPDTFSGFGQQPGGAGLSGAGEGPNSALSNPAAKAPNSFGQFANQFSTADAGLNSTNLGNLGNILASNPGAAIAAGGLGLDALKGNKQSGAEKNLEAQAGQLNSQGQQLENYLQTGTLPAGEQAGVNQALQSVIASIKSKYASMGMSGSSAEQQDIANAQSQAQSQAAQMQEQLLSTGISETGMSSQLYQELMKNSIANDSNLSNSISNFASAAAGGGGISAEQLLKLTGAGGTH